LQKLNEFPDIYDVQIFTMIIMHKLLISECQTGASSVRKQKCFGLYLLKSRTYA